MKDKILVTRSSMPPIEEYMEEIESMALNGSELIGAMGVDTPLAVLSKQYHPLFEPYVFLHLHTYLHL